MQIPTPASSAKTFRTAARRALAGRWSDALTWLAVLPLICGGLFGAGFTFNQAEDTVNPAVYWRLQAQIGPYYSVSYWQDGEMVLDAAENASAPGLVACTPAFLAAALTLAIVCLLLLGPDAFLAPALAATALLLMVLNAASRGKGAAA